MIYLFNIKTDFFNKACFFGKQTNKKVKTTCSATGPITKAEITWCCAYKGKQKFQCCFPRFQTFSSSLLAWIVNWAIDLNMKKKVSRPCQVRINFFFILICIWFIIIFCLDLFIVPNVGVKENAKTIAGFYSLFFVWIYRLLSENDLFFFFFWSPIGSLGRATSLFCLYFLYIF